MIQSIEINNYRSHKNTKVNFTNLTGIQGYHGHGKSSIWSAAQMVLLCKPWPEYALHNGETKGSVKVTMSNGVSVTRLRTKTENFLIVEEPGKDSITYRNPLKMLETVSRVTGFRAIQLDQKTFESVQLVSSGAAQNFMQNVTPETMLKRTMSLVAGSELEEIKNKLKVDLAEIESDIKTCNGIIEFSNNQIAQLDQGKIEAGLAILIEAEELDGHVTSLRESIDSVKADMHIIVSLNEQLVAMEHIAESYHNNWDEANKLFNTLDNLRVNRKAVREIVESIDLLNNELTDLVGENIAVGSAIHDVEFEINQLPKCPKCGNPL